MTIVRPIARAACITLVLVAAGCGGSSTSITPTSPTTPTTPTTPTPPVATTTVAYSGLFASGLFTGAVTMTAQVPVTSTSSFANVATIAASATGTAKFSGASTTTINLTGTYDTVTGKFTLSTAGWTVEATVINGVASGTITTPAGAGSVAALQTTQSNPAVNYCGTYAGTESGKFVVTIRNGLASGVAAENGSPGGIALVGTASGNSVTLSWSWTEGSGGRGTAVGTINGTSIGGTWSNTDNRSGTWTGNSGC